MAQEPVVKFWVLVSLRPRVVSDPRINGQFHVLAAVLFQERNHPFGLAHIYGGIFVPMKDPKGKRLDGGLLVALVGHYPKRASAPADGRHGREPLGISKRQAP